MSAWKRLVLGLSMLFTRDFESSTCFCAFLIATLCPLTWAAWKSSAVYRETVSRSVLQGTFPQGFAPTVIEEENAKAMSGGEGSTGRAKSDVSMRGLGGGSPSFTEHGCSYLLKKACLLQCTYH